MAHDRPGLAIGDVVSLSGATRRTLQYYDRIGLLPAGRDAAGRRRYAAADVTRLQFIQMLTSLGLPLTTVGELVHGPGMVTDLQLLRRQRSVLELEEMRVRGRRTVIDAIVRALEAVPGAGIGEEALPALVDSDAALPAYADADRVSGGDDVGATDAAAVAFVVEAYFRWKAVSVHALVLAENQVDPAAPAGIEVGREWQTYLDLVAGGEVAQSVFEKGRADSDSWPEADRYLHARTESYLAHCHDSYLRRPT